jgi:hypothetical protein
VRRRINTLFFLSVRATSIASLAVCDLPAIIKALVAFVLTVALSWAATTALRELAGATHVLYVVPSRSLSLRLYYRPANGEADLHAVRLSRIEGVKDLLKFLRIYA